MLIERGYIKATDVYKFAKEDKLEIKSQYGITEIIVNNTKINYVLNYKITQSVSENIILEVTRIVPYNEVLHMEKQNITAPQEVMKEAMGKCI